MGSSSSCGVESVRFNLFTLPWNARENKVMWCGTSKVLCESEIGKVFTPAAGSWGRVTKHSVVRIIALYAYLMLKFQECSWHISVVTSTKRSRFLQTRLIWTTTVNVPGAQQLEQNSGFPRIQKRQLFQTLKSNVYSAPFRSTGIWFLCWFKYWQRQQLHIQYSSHVKVAL